MMEIAIDWKASGWFGFCADPANQAKLRKACKAAQEQAWKEWLTRRQTPSLADRFSPEQMGRLQLTERSERYRRRQQKRLGRAVPYFSPRFGGTPHMKDLLLSHRQWNVRTPRPAGSYIVTRMTLRGARILNLNASKTGKQSYLTEFLRLQHPSNALDRVWLTRRAQEILWSNVQELLANYREKTVKRLDRMLRRAG